MIRRGRYLIMLVAVFLVLVGNAAWGFDYFTAERDGQGPYLKILEGAHVNTVLGSIGKGRMDNAMNDLRYTLERFPNHPQGLQLMGMAAQILKNASLAVGYYEKAISAYPQYALTRAQFGLYLVGIGDVDGGMIHLSKSIEMDEKLAAGYAGLAHAYLKKNDHRQAQEAARKARELGFAGKFPEGL